MSQETCTLDAQPPEIRARKPLGSFVVEGHRGSVGQGSRRQAVEESRTQGRIELKSWGAVIRCVPRMHDLKVHMRPAPLCLHEHYVHTEQYQRVLLGEELAWMSLTWSWRFFIPKCPRKEL
jgi:hypothetical protein